MYFFLTCFTLEGARSAKYMLAGKIAVVSTEAVRVAWGQEKVEDTQL